VLTVDDNDDDDDGSVLPSAYTCTLSSAYREFRTNIIEIRDIVGKLEAEASFSVHVCRWAMAEISSYTGR
jgi:ABC-type transport system involved in Fe-S cluster assembly fused permease/ATPase subunit